MLLVLWYYKFAFIFIKVLVLTDLSKSEPFLWLKAIGRVLILIFFYCITLLSLLY